MTDRDPQEVADELSRVLDTAEPGLTDREIAAISRAIEHLEANAEDGTGAINES